MLLGIFEQGKFLFGVNISEFSSEPMPYDAVSGGPQKVGAEHEGLLAAVEFMKPILDKYIKKECTREAMAVEKKTKYAEHLAEKKSEASRS